MDDSRDADFCATLDENKHFLNQVLRMFTCAGFERLKGNAPFQNDSCIVYRVQFKMTMKMQCLLFAE